MNTSNPHARDPRTAVVSTTRMLAGVLTAAPIVMGVALAVVLLPMEGSTDLNPLAAVFPGLGLLIHLLLDQVVWPNLAPVDPGLDEAETWSQAAAKMQANMFTRFALTEAPVLVGIVVAFLVTSGGFTVFCSAAATTIVLMLLHVCPRPSVTRRTEELLDANGARTQFASAFGH